jgi:hypothetical protein
MIVVKRLGWATAEAFVERYVGIGSRASAEAQLTSNVDACARFGEDGDVKINAASGSRDTLAGGTPKTVEKCRRDNRCAGNCAIKLSGRVRGSTIVVLLRGGKVVKSGLTGEAAMHASCIGCSDVQTGDKSKVGELPSSECRSPS